MKSLAFSLLVSLSLGTLVHADILLFDRGLPASTNVNNTAGANRSNVDWGNQDGFINGDDFTVGPDPWNVTAITFWMVGNPLAFTDYKLYGGVAGGPTFGVIPSTLTAIEAHYQPPNASIACNTPVVGVTYQGSGGGCDTMYELKFAVNLNLAAGTVFNVAPDATPVDPLKCVVGGDVSGCFYVHATNAALADAFQEGSNNKYISFDTLAANGDPLEIDSNGNGWDKSSDINLRVYGTIPEPSMAVLMLSGLGVILIRLRKR